MVDYSARHQSHLNDAAAAGRAAWCAVVIPAHDEERVIVRCLESVAAASAGERVEVAVVANGCTDRTASAARGVDLSGLSVLEVATASKVAALNAGDAAVDAFPRIYLDADITLSPEALGGMVAALETDRAVVAAPRIRFDTRAATWPVRAFYEVFRTLPYASQGLVGLGVYGLSASGRERFTEFPELTADDLFVQRLFAPHERLSTPGEYVVRAPADLANLLRVRTRVARGNAELAATAAPAGADFAATGGGTLSALIRLVVRRPTLAPAAAIYLAVGVGARIRARRRDRGWDRDSSTR